MNQEKTKNFKRATAIKLHINQLSGGSYVKDEVSNYLQTQIGIRVSRVRILGTIVNKWIPSSDSERTPQATIIIDDGTATIRIKAWKDNITIFEDVEIGDIVDIIGHVRKYEEEIYITPELIKKIEDPNWELVRELEIIECIERIKSGQRFQEYSSPTSGELTKNAEITGSDKTEKSIFKDKIVELIRNLDDGVGVSVLLLKEQANIPEIDFHNAIMELINEGTIYQPNSGKYKIL
ncbi:MAG: OB-fold nucleic acid binding domain-containing protein [Candidatus Helarchaeota archaeon]